MLSPIITSNLNLRIYSPSTRSQYRNKTTTQPRTQWNATIYQSGGHIHLLVTTGIRGFTLHTQQILLQRVQDLLDEITLTMPRSEVCEVCITPFRTGLVTIRIIKLDFKIWFLKGARNFPIVFFIKTNGLPTKLLNMGFQ